MWQSCVQSRQVTTPRTPHAVVDKTSYSHGAAENRIRQNRHTASGQLEPSGLGPRRQRDTLTTGTRQAPGSGSTLRTRHPGARSALENHSHPGTLQVPSVSQSSTATPYRPRHAGNRRRYQASQRGTVWKQAPSALLHQAYIPELLGSGLAPELQRRGDTRAPHLLR